MEEDGHLLPVTAAATSSSQPPRRREEESESESGLKKGCLSFLVSLQEGFGYVKAFVVGQASYHTSANDCKTRPLLQKHAMKLKVKGLKKCFVGATGTIATKKMTARNEKEATRADLETAKMQVEATDAAEDTKQRLDISS